MAHPLPLAHASLHPSCNRAWNIVAPPAGSVLTGWYTEGVTRSQNKNSGQQWSIILGGIIVLGTLVGAAATPPRGQTAGSSATLDTSPYKDYKQWTRMNDAPVYSPTHSRTFVDTYLNSKGLSTAKEGKFPFPVGTAIVKEAFVSQGCEPGALIEITVMEKRAPGYDPEANDWHWARYGRDGILQAEGKSGGEVNACVVCHSGAKVNDYVFGTSTSIKATPTITPGLCQ